VAKLKIQYLLFDVESVADGELISRVRYPGLQLPPDEAVGRYRRELMEKHGSDFIPYTHQIPVSVVVAKVTEDFRLDDLVALDEPEFRPHVITRHFWLGWEKYHQPTLVTFNGRGFDVPLLELAAFRYGISIPRWFADGLRSYEQPRNRYNTQSHFDLQDLLVNYGATRFNGGLNLAATLLGKPGKMDVQGDMVQDMFNAGRLDEINAYCRCDVLDTYFVFLRCQVLTGNLSLEEETNIVTEAKSWLEQRADQCDAYAAYLQQWGDWSNPWDAEG
jgi:predicted PolB exonuclease-like 3'-5' exonuclease